jgi:hypothetical protein
MLRHTPADTHCSHNPGKRQPLLPEVLLQHCQLHHLQQQVVLLHWLLQLPEGQAAVGWVVVAGQPGWLLPLLPPAAAGTAAAAAGTRPCPGSTLCTLCTTSCKPPGQTGWAHHWQQQQQQRLKEQQQHPHQHQATLAVARQLQLHLVPHQPAAAAGSTAGMHASWQLHPAGQQQHQQPLLVLVLLQAVQLHSSPQLALDRPRLLQQALLLLVVAHPEKAHLM